MKIIEADFELLTPVEEIKEMPVRIERYGRVCYKSEEKINSGSAKTFIKSLIARGHESVIEHCNITVRFICDRGVSHELVRHRIGSYSQESTRYCHYGKDKFGKEITFIKPLFWDPDGYEYNSWIGTMQNAEDGYFELINLGTQPQEARSVLPNSLKTEVVFTYNLRQWRHFFKERCSKAAHPQMRELSIPLLKVFIMYLPEVFQDLEPLLKNEYIPEWKEK